ncbi:hypothetical protein QTP86_028010 [Hemibagrus guttatus]|nr:hypothetical protein QTP86_028010 [Hemibagrus guttatus]
MTGKGRELADVMERRKVDILCVQETRWKGSKARSIGAGFKLFYYGVDSKRNGVGVVLKEELVRNVLEVKRVSDRVMSLKLEIEGVMLNVVSGYAPQVGCELEEKERFWSELDEVMESIPTGERVVIGADFNGHVGEGNSGDEEVMGKFGVKERNLEGQMVVDFAKRMDMAVVNTYFQKREEHRVTYKSGGRRTQVDYILCRRGNLKEISDCKVVVGESVARQHRMVVCRMTLMVCKKKRSKIEKKTKWWKLKKEECCEEFRQKLRQALGGQVLLPDDWETTAEVIRETGRKVLGVSSGRRKEEKETWWWNEEVQDSIQRKRLAKKKWDMDRTEENRQEYKELQRRVKREVSKAKQKAYDELYTRLDTREGEKDLYRLARQRDRDGKDVQQVRVIKDRDGRVLTSEESVQRRWKEYFEELMNEENEREKRVEGVNSVEQKVDKIRKDEVRKALKRMKCGKAVGPDDIPVEVWKCLGEAAVEFLASLFNRVLESERMPEEWRRSVLVPIFKNKGDVQSCSNYRGIKLMSHTMKLWERVVEARLRKVVEICEQQYGFMPRKSTTDAIFALRILMEKYRDGQRELHCVFVDLEKAYDRVPREELWYCMRKSGVAEKYVRVVQDMYERSRTVVRCAVGQTEEFNVEVGLHQGSALSPFLFAIVMDQLSEEVRQESPWTMMFADDIVICSESREQVEENLERWRFALERRGMKVSRSKTEYMCVNEREGSGTVRLQGEEVKKVQEFKYLGSTVQSNGECGKEVKKRVQAGWNGWRKVSGVLCDQKISARIKGKVYRTVVRAAMLYGLETVSLRKRQESELEVAELKMLRFSLGVTRLDRIRNEYIRGTAHVGRLGDKVREARLRWFGHVQRREAPSGFSQKEKKPTESITMQKNNILDDIQKLRLEIETVMSEIHTMESNEENKNIIMSRMFLCGKKKFNMDPGIQYLLDNDLLNETPEAVAEFLYKEDGLNKTAIGNFLGERQVLAPLSTPSSVTLFLLRYSLRSEEFHLQILKAFVDLHEFSDLNLVQALRQFLWSFRLPGEAQKIDRMMEAFAQRYCTCNNGVFQSTDSCYILSFAIIMLNTSLHNPNVKEKPTLEAFISMNRGLDHGGDLPRDLLTKLYESISSEPFKIPVDDGNDLTHTFFNPDREGWLLKEGGRVKTWKRRWFILTDSCLYYFQYTTDKEPKGIIPLENLSIREVDDPHKQFCFELFMPHGKGQKIKACKTDPDGKVVVGKHSAYKIKASSAEERDDWVQAISNSKWYSVVRMVPTCSYACLTTSGHALNEMTNGVLGYFLPDLDQCIIELLDSLRCNLAASDGLLEVIL